jgi:tetratricopeptide (TPR) repeat protein
VHLNNEGNFGLARAVAEAVSTNLPNIIRSEDKQVWDSFEQCSRRLALTDWDRRRICESLLRRLVEPPFVNQMDHADQINSLRQLLATVRARQTPEALRQARSLYREAIEAAPEDFYLRADFAKLEEDAGNLPEAITQWRAARDLIPFGPGPHYYLGRVLDRQGSTQEALQELDLALAIRPDLAEALDEKGSLLVKMKQAEKGLQVLERAAQLEPGNARISLDRAEALAAMGRRAEALSQLQRAVQQQPAYWEARYLLGVELAFNGDLRSAAEQFLETIRLNPAYALGHLNLGIALAKLDKTDEAMTQFQETLRLDPNNQKAAEYLKALQGGAERKSKR